LKPEVYLVNDFGADRMLHNESEPGKLNFRLMHGKRSLMTPRSMAVGRDSFNGMGIDFADLNDDGRLDFIVSNITSDYGLHQSNLVFIHSGASGDMNRGIAPFTNHSERYGLSRGGWTWDTKFGDFDNDGVLEVMQTTGFMNGKINRWPEFHELGLANEELAKYPIVYPQLGKDDAVSDNEHNPFFVRKDGRYYDIADHLGESFNEPKLSRGIATADVDGDGRLDFALANNWEDSYFFRNTGDAAGRFLGLHLRLPPAGIGEAMTRSESQEGTGRREYEGPYQVRTGHPGNDIPSLPAIGAQATIKFHDGKRERTMVCHVDGGNGHSGQRSPELHFGLGEVEAETAIKASIRWRDRAGKVQACTITGLRPGWHTVYLWGDNGNTKFNINAR
jgi:hypothetical protein